MEFGVELIIKIDSLNEIHDLILKVLMTEHF